MKRYELRDPYNDAEIVEDAEGTFVRWTDTEALRARVKALGDAGRAVVDAFPFTAYCDPAHPIVTLRKLLEHTP